MMSRHNIYEESCRDGLFAKSRSLRFFFFTWPLKPPEKTLHLTGLYMFLVKVSSEFNLHLIQCTIHNNIDDLSD
jgi:hypothetical protein